jgi:hypothetical protein
MTYYATNNIGPIEQMRAWDLFLISNLRLPASSVSKPRKPRLKFEALPILVVVPYKAAQNIGNSRRVSR